MSQAQARSWWADVEHLREAAERRQATEAEHRVAQQRAAERRARAVSAPAETETARARTRVASRVLEAADGAVDELSARRAVVLDDQAPRPRRPVPIWLADDAFSDPVASARARAAAPRRTIEIRGQMTMPADSSAAVHDPQHRPEAGTGVAVSRRARHTAGLTAPFAARPDRLAFWAFAMGLMLALAAAASGGHA